MRNFLDRINLGLALALYISVWGLSFVVLSFINSKGCGQIVIDGYEFRSGIDIPAVDFYNCYYDEKKDVRMSVYKLKVNADDYIQKHNHHKGEQFNQIDLKNINFSIPLSGSQQPSSKQLYVSTGTRHGNTWQYVVEKESGRMWVEMKYTPTLATDILEKEVLLIYLSPVLLLAVYLFRLFKNLYINNLKPPISTTT